MPAALWIGWSGAMGLALRSDSTSAALFSAAICSFVGFILVVGDEKYPNPTAMTIAAEIDIAGMSTRRMGLVRQKGGRSPRRSPTAVEAAAFPA